MVDKKEDGEEESSFGDRFYLDGPTETWSNLHSLPIKRYICKKCDVVMFTTKPFILKDKADSDKSWVGLTTLDNGKHACQGDDNISVGKYIMDDTAESVFHAMYKKLLKSEKE